MPNPHVPAAATGLPIPHPRLVELIEREKLRTKIEAAVARLIDALDAIDAPGEDMEDGLDAEAVNEDGGDINDEPHDDDSIEPNATGVYGNSGVLARA